MSESKRKPTVAKKSKKLPLLFDDFRDAISGTAPVFLFASILPTLPLSVLMEFGEF